MLSTDPDERDMPAMWASAAEAGEAVEDGGRRRSSSLADVPVQALRSALGITAEAAGMPAPW